MEMEHTAFNLDAWRRGLRHGTGLFGYLWRIRMRHGTERVKPKNQTSIIILNILIDKILILFIK